MLTKLIDFSLNNRLVVVVLVGICALWGSYSFLNLPWDAFPDTTPVQVQINTTAPALSPLEIERQVTYPLEQVLSGLPGLQQVRSASKFGFSQITVVFEDHIDIYLARQLVMERIQPVRLPSAADPPALGPISTGLGEVFQYLVRSETLSATELRTLHHWVVRPRMLQVPGVAEINTWGGYEKQYHIIVEPDHLLTFALTLDDVARAVSNGLGSAGGGRVGSGGESLLVRGDALVEDLDELGKIVVASHNGVPVLLEQVAELRPDHEIRRGAVTAEGRGEAVLGLGFMLMGENSRTLTQSLENRLEEIAGDLPEEVVLQPVYSRTDLVDQVLHTVRNNLLEGALLVIAVLFMFLGSPRAGLIVAAAIPLSMLFAFSGMLRFGIVGSLMSLGALDFGLIVDSSVIMVENASRRLQSADPRNRLAVIREACLEVRKPTLFGELIIAVVYLPILTLEGIEGKLFRPMALTVIFALTASMILSMTLMPVLVSFFLRAGGSARDTWLVRGLKRVYRPVLDLVLRAKVLVLVCTLAILVFAGLVASRLGSEFVPRLREGAVVINTVRLAGVSLEESVRYGSRIEAYLLEQFPNEIDHIWTRTGTADVATDPMGLELSDVFITLKPRKLWEKARSQEQLVRVMNGALEGFPGMRLVFTQPIEMRMNEMTAGIRSDIGIKIFGEDFDQLNASAEQIRLLLEAMPGAADVTVEQLTGSPLLDVQVNREALARHGIAAAEVLQVVRSLGSLPLGEMVEGRRRFDIVLRLHDQYRNDPDKLADIAFLAADGRRIPLDQLATIQWLEGPATIQREWARRRILVQCNVRDRDVGSFVAELRETLARAAPLPEDYFLEIDGSYRHLESARKRLAVAVPTAVALVFFLLFLTYRRLSDTLRVFTGVPFAAVGGIAALYWRDLPFSISAAVGFIALSGVAVLGDMVLVSRIRYLEKRGAALLDAVKEAALSRLRPVCMTALVAAFGFVPMALNTGVGAEIQRPLATVVIGGMVTSTIGTLLVMPVLYTWFAGRRQPGSEEALP